MFRILLFTCHFIADYSPLSMPFMLKAKATGSPILNIAAHGLVHAFLMFIVSLLYVPVNMALLLFFIQLITHTGIDTLKGRLNVWFPQLKNTASKKHWAVFGTDQFLHIMVIELMWFLSYTL